MSDKLELKLALEQSEIKNLFYNRLQITIVRNGLTFKEDLRDRQSWHNCMLKNHETSVMTELDIDHAFIKLLTDRMLGFGWSLSMIKQTLSDLTNKRVYFDIPTSMGLTP